MTSKALIVLQIIFIISPNYLNFIKCEDAPTVGKLREVFAWKQLTFDIDGNILTQSSNSNEQPQRSHLSKDRIIFSDNVDPIRIWGQPPPDRSTPVPASTSKPADGRNDFFIQYNNVPMGVERVHDRLFIAIPRRRYGIPATLNVINLTTSKGRSPPLSPYPNLKQSKLLTSVYRTRADKCGRLWMVDTGLMEIPDDPQQVQPPAVVIYDLRTDRQILRYPFKSSDIPAANTPTGLASITVDISTKCEDAYAYVPDLTTFGLIVFSLQKNDSWRLSHNYFSFNPLAGNLRVSGQTFQWSDGIFSITLSEPSSDGCRKAYFHPLISTQEFSISTCFLKNNTASNDRDAWTHYKYEGDRGEDAQSTMHGYHAGSRVIFYADIGRDAVSCWNTAAPMTADNVAILARDSRALSYPSDLHVTGDEVWVMANTLPRFGYSSLNPNEYNFFVYSGNVKELITGTVCARPSTQRI